MAATVAFSAGLDACYLGRGDVEPERLVRQLIGTVIKDDATDAKQYFDVVVKARSGKSRLWKRYFQARKLLRDA